MALALPLALLCISGLIHYVVERKADRYLFYREIIMFGPAMSMKVSALRILPIFGYIATGVAAAPLFI